MLQQARENDAHRTSHIAGWIVPTRRSNGNLNSTASPHIPASDGAQTLGRIACGRTAAFRYEVPTVAPHHEDGPV